MANGDRTRRKQDGERSGLFDHIVAADLEGIDPPSMDSVPERQMHESIAPPPGETLVAWGDEDPSLTAPRSADAIDGWESVEPKPEVVAPTEETSPTEVVAEAPTEHERAQEYIEIGTLASGSTDAPIDAAQVHDDAQGAIDTEPDDPVDGAVVAPSEPVAASSDELPLFGRAETDDDAPVLAACPVPATTVEPAPVATPLPCHGIWAWLELTRISNVLTVATNAMVGLWVAHLLAGQATIDRFIDWMPRHVGVVAGICLLYLFGMVFNDLTDRDVDAQERPNRPLPSGRVGLRPAILLAATLVSTGVWLVGGGSFPIPGLAAIAVGLAFGRFASGQRSAIQWVGEAWAVVGVAAILWNWLDQWRQTDLRTPWGFESVLLLVAAIVAYSLLHRTWRGSVVLLGLCRALAYWCATLSVMSVSGMQYNGSSASAWGLMLFPGLIAFASTIAVSLPARHEATPTDEAPTDAAPQPTRLWVRVLLVAAVLVPWAFSPVVTGGARGMLQVMTIVALPMALFCGGIFLVKSLHAERAMRSHRTRIAGGVGAWIAAFCLLDASTLSVLGAPGLSVLALGCWWITRTAQRRVAGS